MIDFTRLEDVKRRRPLIHCVSNIVSANDCANLALAVGASPMMAQAPEEMVDITAISAATVLNTGTPDEEKFRACLLCGVAYWKSENLPVTLVAEVFGTGIIGGLLSYPIAIAFMGKAAGDIAFYAYVVPFLVSTVGGSILAGILVFALEKSGALKHMQASLEH